METTTIKFAITATADFVEIGSHLTNRITLEQAREMAASFPKSVKMFATTIYGMDYSGGYFRMSAKLLADGVNGGRNEAGIKRVKTALAFIAKNGWELEEVKFGNSISLDELMTRLG